MGSFPPKALAALKAAKKNRTGKGEDKKKPKSHETKESATEAEAEGTSEGHKELMGSMARKIKKMK